MQRKNKVGYELIVSATQGNMVAIGYILECYCLQIESVLRKMAPWLSEDSLEDCRQEVIKEMIGVIPKFDLNR